MAIFVYLSDRLLLCITVSGSFFNFKVTIALAVLLERHRPSHRYNQLSQLPTTEARPVSNGVTGSRRYAEREVLLCLDTRITGESIAAGRDGRN